MIAEFRAPTSAAPSHLSEPDHTGVPAAPKPPAPGFAGPRPAAPGDPRRARRERAALLVERAAYLPAHDRELVEAVYRDGLSVSAYVRLARARGGDLRRPWRDGTPRPHPADPVALTDRSARRRLRRLVERLLDPRYAFVIAHRTSWPATRRRVAMARLVQGRSMRDIASTLRLSLHIVRRHLEVVEAAFEAHEHAPRAGGAR